MAEKSNNERLINEIRQDLENIKPSRDSHSIQVSIQSIIRAVNRIEFQDKNRSRKLRAISADMMHVFTGEIKYHNLKLQTARTIPERMMLSESFFNSINIIKGDLLLTLEGAE
jgi:hypothetical protein